LPAVNATLNGLAAILLSTSFVMIRRGKRTAHKRCMIVALARSGLFLISYVVYHANAG